MSYSDELPSRVRLLVLGGGIHGVGILHDMASRGWSDVHLIEKSHVGDGTSSRSTKLVHGGLRYLRRLSDFGLVAEALRERQTLMRLAPDLVSPVELLFPILKHGGMPRLMVKAGLTLYDRLAGRYRLTPHARLSMDEARAKAPLLDMSLFSAVYSFWDAQTDDLALVARVAASARKLGAGLSEGVEARRVTQTDDGWDVEVRQADGTLRTISALYVVNALGPWANILLERSEITPPFRGINNKGAHLLFDDVGLKSGLFLQSLKGDGRIFFVLPWHGQTLLGTTEGLHSGSPDDVRVSQADVDYLLENCNRFLVKPFTRDDVRRTFIGLRWLAVEPGHTLTETSRAYNLGERAGKRGLLVTLYGGKLTTYRNLSRLIGDRITRHFGEFHPSRTDSADTWASSNETPSVPSPMDRFTAVS